MKKIALNCLFICFFGSVGAQSITQLQKQAGKLFHEDRYTEAIAIYKEMSLAYPRWYYPVLMTAIANHNMSEYLQEYIYLKKSIRLNSDEPSSYVYLAELFYDIEYLDSAEYYYKKAESYGDYEGRAAMGLAFMFAEKGQFNRAFTKANQAIEYSPKLPEHYADRADIKLLSKDTAGALEDYNTAIKLGKNSTWIYENRADFFLKIKNYKACHADIEKVLSIEPKNTDILYYRACLLDIEGKEDEALNVFEIYYNEYKKSETSYDKLLAHLKGN